MNVRRVLSVCMMAVLTALTLSGRGMAADIKIGIMQAQAGDARKYQSLLDYLGKKGIQAAFVTASTYPAAADMFAKGQVDAMFSGSGVAGAMMVKEVAEPLVRPVNQNGTSTYSAVVVAKKGAGQFTGSAEFFSGKRVIFTPLASSGEFFYRSLGASKAKEIMQAASHGAALDAVSRGQADIAIVKNRVWDADKGKYPDLEQVGKDSTENPDNTLIISRKMDKAAAGKLASILLGVGSDQSPEAGTVRSSLKISKFIKTTPGDFKGTLALLKRAGVTKTFAFKY